MTTNRTTTKIALKPVTPSEFQHGHGDPKEAKRYAVHVDGVLIGHVQNQSSESWATSGRIRTRQLGYSREWWGTLGERTDIRLSHRNPNAAAHGYTRKDAVDRLIEAWKTAQKG